MLELIEPTVALHPEWLEAHAEWGAGLHEDGFGLLPDDEVESAAGFAAWLLRLASQSDPAQTVDRGAHQCSYRWIVEGSRVLGGIALRVGDDDYTPWAGHIGYGIRPSERRRGIATWALDRMFDEARASGMTRVLAVCDAGNRASAAMIERAGGQLERVEQTKFGPACRYWFEL